MTNWRDIKKKWATTESPPMEGLTATDVTVLILAVASMSMVGLLSRDECINLDAKIRGHLKKHHPDLNREMEEFTEKQVQAAAKN